MTRILARLIMLAAWAAGAMWGQVTITPASPTLPTATIGTPYSQMLSATGGTPPYTWSITTGSLPTPLLLNSTTGAITGTPSPSAITSTFTVQVVDSSTPANTASATFTLPVAIMISTTTLPNGTVGVSYSQTLAAIGGSGQYTWAVSVGALPAGLTLAPATGVISGKPTTAGPVNFTIQVTDSNLAVATQAFTLTINPALTIVTTSPLPPATIGVLYSDLFTASGGSGSGYTWSVTGQPTWLAMTAAGTLSGTPPATATTSTFTVKVMDSAGDSTSASFTLPVNLTITTTSPLPAGSVGTNYSDTLTAIGGSGQYTWSVSAGALPAGLTLAPATGVISGKPTTAGPVNFTIEVTDSNLAVATQAFTLTINAALTIVTTSPLPPATIGVAYSELFSAAGGSGSGYTWSVTGQPAWLSMTPAGTLSGTPPATAITATFTVKVMDSAGNSGSGSFTLPVNLAITTTSPLPPATVGASYSQTLAAVGGSGQYTWSVAAGSTLPTGLTLTPAGVIGGKPTTSGAASFTIQVTDSNQLATSALFTLTINPALLITTTSPLPTATVGMNYSQTLAATGGSGQYTWSLATGSSLPSGLSLTPATGAISGKPTTAGPASFTIQVTDSNQVTASMTFTLTIDPPLVITTTSPLPTGTVGVTYSQTLAASGGSGQYTWTLAAGSSLPGGLSLAPATGVISGQPSGATTANFTIQVTDSNQVVATAPFTLTINPALAITTSSPLPVGTVGVNYSQTLAASGGSGQYTWSVGLGSSLPAGLTLTAATGVISGQPTAAGSSTFTIQVTDSNQVTASKQLTLTINAALVIVTSSPLPPGTVGINYSQNLSASGGSGQYTWSISAGSLPSGISLNSSTGVISGESNTATTSNFTIQVTDSNQVTASKQLALTIDAVLAITTSSPLANGIVGVTYNQTLAGSGGAMPYTWSLTAGALPSGLGLAASTGVISGQPTATGAFQFTIKLTDSTNPANTVTKPFVITVSAGLTINSAPTLPNATVGVSYSQILTAAGGATPYTWAITKGTLPAGLSFTSTSSNATITGDPSAAGQSTFTVTVTDSASITASQTFTLTVVTPPAINTASPLPNGTAGVPYSLNLAGSGGTQPYSWALSSGSLPAGLSLTAAGAIIGTPTTAGTSTFKVQLTDAEGVTASQSFTLTIITGLAVSTTSPLPTGEATIAYSQTLTAAGGTLPYKWSVIGGALPAGLMLATSGSLTGAPTAAGTYNFTVQVTDSKNVTASAPLAVTIAGLISISTPAALPSASLNSNYSQTLAASAGVAPYKWSLTTGPLPLGLTLFPTGIVSGAAVATGTFPFTVTVTDALGATASRKFTITVVNGLTISTPASLPGATIGVAYSETLQAAGGSGSYSWSIIAGALPAGLSFNAAGKLGGIPTAVGTSSFTVEVTDSLQHQATEQMTLTVAQVLSITSTSLPGATLGTAYSQSLTASGGTPPYTWSILNGSLPGGLALSAAGAITGSATASGTFSFTAKVTDSAGFIAIKQLSITVAGGITISTAASLPNANLNGSYSQSLSAAGGTPPYTWTLTSGALPTGVQLSAAGALTGTPTASGIFEFTVTVADSAGAAASRQFTLIVSGGLSIAPTTLPGGVLGEPYNQTLTATGGTAPYTFTTSAGSLPPGITLAAGALTGTPTTKGSYTFTIQATDSASIVGTQQFTVVIAALGIVTPALPAAAVGTPYSQSLSASGTKPYTWAVTEGTLPVGLSLDASSGTISGTPTAPGTSTITIQVTDSTKATASANYTLIVISGSFSGLSSTAAPAQQVSGTLALGAAYPQEIDGQIMLTFQPDAALSAPAVDPSIQFSTGGTTASFTIPANSTAPISFDLQTGTVAGTITLTVDWQASGSALAVPAALTQTIQIAPAAPVITAVSTATVTGGFQVLVTGYSNTREVDEAVLQFTPAAGQNLQTNSLTVSLTSASSTWFQSSTSDQYGGQFVLTLPFNVSDGSASSIGSVSVQLVNSQGTSASASGTLP